MERIGDEMLDEVAEYGTIADSIGVVLRGKRRKHSNQGRYILGHRDEVISKLQTELREGTFRLKGYHEMLVTDGPKVRRVQSVSLYDRVGMNAFCTVAERRIHGRWIRTTAASIKNRGTHDLLNYIRRDILLDPDGTKYWYKWDWKKFYENIDHGIMMQACRHIFKGKKTLTLLEDFITMLEHGLSIGLRSSQILANMLASIYIDHVLKDEYRLRHRHHYRYCDDGSECSDSKQKLWIIRDIVNELSAGIGLTIKHNERIFPVTEGIDYLGYVIYPEKTLLRKRNKKKAARRLKKVKSKKRRRELEASLYAMLKHCNGRHLFKVLTGKTMIEFKEVGMTYKADDGKKHFNGEPMKLSRLVNTHIIIKDFETDVKTKNGLRTLVSFEKEDGTLGKYFTEDKQQLYFLQQFRDKGLMLFRTEIQLEHYGDGKIRYIFT